MIQLLNNKTHAYLISDKIHYQKGYIILFH